ncbi:WD repeat-containing protein 74 [Schistocerca cancellata]|uniref:WD repeat-containing protein 74 n=1 Tax=Schistocerca cancellata TaxID=274614 RepID=UPI0021173939|nr:WD repeat-containing protein 74 [Schistocerca cancellata]
MSYKRDSNIFAGCLLGTFKGLQFHGDESEWKVFAKNLQKVGSLQKDNGITHLSWGDDDEVDILIGLKNKTVKTYDTDYKAFTSSVNVEYGEGQICGLSKYDRCLLTAVESGHIRVWRFKEKEGDVFNSGRPIQKMKHSKVNKNIVAFGSKNHADLKLLDLNTKQYTFISKNVRKNELELQVPIWPSDLVFLPDGDRSVAVCTKYGQVRLYDTKGPAKRPVLSVDIPLGSLPSKSSIGREMCSLTCMSSTMKDRCVVVGSGRGQMKLIDFRGKSHIAKSYKGPVGGIRSIACSATEPYVVSVSLDRYLRIHHLDEAKPLYQGYQKMKLNCVLVRSQMILPDIKEEEQEKQNDQKVDSDDDIQIVAEYDSLFDDMAVLEET